MPSQIPHQPSQDKNKKGDEQKPDQKTQGQGQQQKPATNPAKPIDRDTQFDKGQGQDLKGQEKSDGFEPFDARRKTQPIDEADLGPDGDDTMSDQPSAYRTAANQGPGSSKIDRNTMSDQPGALRNKDTE